MNDKGSKLWGGRFTEATDEFVEQFNASVEFDKRLYKQDILGSKVHAQMLVRIGILNSTDCDSLLRALDAIQAEIEAGSFHWDTGLEDVHMNIEARLTELVGEAGKRLHTGRSRNDQVVTDVRLYLRDAIDAIDQQLEKLQLAILSVAKQEADTIMPGFTHLQVAQVITFGHHMLAWFEMIFRDRTRLQQCRVSVNFLPLGAAALAGSSFALDRDYVAQQLHFTELCHNSLDAVSDRDFAIEFCAFGAILFAHLSRMAEELVLWTSTQFNFIELPDRFCTGSSIMPQKKNPDVPELVRGKSARVYANLFALLTLMKSQPLAYNKDNQEDKEPLFDSVDTTHDCVTVFANMLPHIKINHERLLEAAQQGYATATDLADYLVQRKVPFRDAHEVVGKTVKYAIAENKQLDQLSLQELQRFSPSIGEDVFGILSLQGSVASKNTYGGTSPKQVAIQLKLAQHRLQDFKAKQAP
ncbi:MAG: argininosuccinate lyase [Gammaproteobacteria bacterium]|nr:argininosuccinate lyase [Gammaproteobacteria bacterium]